MVINSQSFCKSFCYKVRHPIGQKTFYQSLLPKYWTDDLHQNHLQNFFPEYNSQTNRGRSTPSSKRFKKRGESSNSGSRHFKTTKRAPKKNKKKATKKRSRQDFFTKLVDKSSRWDKKEKEDRRQILLSHLSPQHR